MYIRCIGIYISRKMNCVWKLEMSQIMIVVRVSFDSRTQDEAREQKGEKKGEGQKENWEKERR